MTTEYTPNQTKYWNQEDGRGISSSAMKIIGDLDCNVSNLNSVIHSLQGVAERQQKEVADLKADLLTTCDIAEENTLHAMSVSLSESAEAYSAELETIKSIKQKNGLE